MIVATYFLGVLRAIAYNSKSFIQSDDLGGKGFERL